MKTRPIPAFLLFLAATIQFSAAQNELPAWIPKVVGPDGRYTPAGMRFTTPAYEREALRLVLQEANQIAKELELPEKLPITERTLEKTFILGFGMSQTLPKAIGNIHTQDFGYFVSVDHKFSFISRRHQDEDCLKWREIYSWPVGRIDTNGAFQLATQWLGMARMDVQALNRDCEVRVEISRFWNDIKPGQKLYKKSFVPIYDVAWLSPKNRAENYGCVASITLLQPTKILIDLSVYDTKYILRSPLVFTNLVSLLAQTNTPVSAGGVIQR